MSGQTAATFEANRMVRSAVVYQLTVIGEAVARLPFGTEVWHAASQDIPVLRRQIAAVMEAEPSS